MQREEEKGRGGGRDEQQSTAVDEQNRRGVSVKAALSKHDGGDSLSI